MAIAAVKLTLRIGILNVQYVIWSMRIDRLYWDPFPEGASTPKCHFFSRLAPAVVIAQLFAKVWRRYLFRSFPVSRSEV
jgi:hypothetical protein